MRSALAGLLTVGAFAADDAARQPHRVVSAGDLRVLVPEGLAEQLQPFCRQAAVWYRQLADDAGYEINEPLWLWLSDYGDLHNGFSTVLPRPLVGVELAPSLPVSTIFSGGDDRLRTLIHEYAHHISNDRNHGFRGVVAAIFGRVLPFDVLSLGVFYLSVPAHVTMPRFWHEGFAQWVETAYADPDSAWAGRGRDPLTHMQWRLDVAAGGVPPVGDWRITYHRWPYGGSIYRYGIAYFRYLVAAFDEDPWRMVEEQGRQWAFAFDSGIEDLVGFEHSTLLARMRRALEQEQLDAIAHLRSQPTTTTSRLTPRDAVVGAPAWTADGSIVLAVNPLYDRPRLEFINGSDRDRSGIPAHFTPAVRASDDGRLLVDVRYDRNRRAQVRLIEEGDERCLPLSWYHPDVRSRSEDVELVGVAIHPGGRTALARVQLVDGEPVAQPVAKSEGQPWSPAYRPGAEEFCWVETDESGSRLVLDALAGESRQVLVELPGRILHPSWDASGEHVYFCADHTGVANAWRLSVDSGEMRPVTHTLGGVVACVPAPEVDELAIIDHDHDGPYLARISADPAMWPAEVVALDLPWPAPLAKSGHDEGEDTGTPTHAVRSAPDLAAADAVDTDVGGYHGLLRMRPLFWTPTTAPVPEGGIGVAGVAADPLFTHTAVAGAGVGPQEGEFVGMLGYSFSGWPLDVGAVAWRSERTYGDELRFDDGTEADYTEVVEQGALQIGRGIAGLERDVFAVLSAGMADYDAVEETLPAAESTTVSRPTFEGEERYLQLDIGYDNRLFFADGFAPDDGWAVQASYRHSGLGGDLERDRVTLAGSLAVPVWRAGGHQLHLALRGGWSDGDETLQGAFAIGGALGGALPRGYFDREATGDHLAAGSIAYRAALWRPFDGYGSAPFAHRQLVLEVFYDGAKVSTDEPLGNGTWFRSAGGTVYTSWEVWAVLVQPGLGIAVQIDGDEDVVPLFSLGFLW